MTETLSEFFATRVAGQTWLAWTLALAVAAGTCAVLLTARWLVRRLHARRHARQPDEIVDIPLEVLARTTLLFVLVVSASLGLQPLVLGSRVDRVAHAVLTIVLFWQAGLWVAAGAAAILERKRRQALVENKAALGSIGILRFIATLTIWTVVLLLTLDNLGIDVTALVAGLGIGGIAVALAVQNMLGDLFAALSITLDEPFVVGDFLILDDFMGSVEYIGIKSTRLRSLSGEQIVMPNSDLVSSRVRNYGRMQERRVVFTLRVTYDTPYAMIEAIPAIIRAAIERQEGTRFDRSHFATYGMHALEYESVYYVLTGDYNRYMDTQQAINLEIFREFARRGIAFALPTQKLLLEGIGHAPEPEGDDPPRAAVPS
jgi:small-conductance mechanosensitive channel